MSNELEKKLIKSNQYQTSKSSYDSSAIPEQLDSKVRGIFKDFEKTNRMEANNMIEDNNKEHSKSNIIKEKEGKKNQAKQNRKAIIVRRVGVAVAACFGMFIIGLNTSESFAVRAEKIPFIGSVAKVFTLRSYDDTNADRILKAEVPQIDVDTKDEVVEQKVVDINAEIDVLVQQCIESANQHIAEYKEAFIATGGTEEEFTDKNIHANVTYEVKAQNDEMISIVITSSEDWASAYTEQYFYTLDLNTGDMITLQDILGEDYIAIANQSIRDTMEQRVDEDKDFMYFTEDEGGFTSIDSNTKFYVNEKGNPVVVFAKYEVAPGFMGIQEFEIQR